MIDLDEAQGGSHDHHDAATPWICPCIPELIAFGYDAELIVFLMQYVYGNPGFQVVAILDGFRRDPFWWGKTRAYRLLQGTRKCVSSLNLFSLTIR